MQVDIFLVYPVDADSWNARPSQPEAIVGSYDAAIAHLEEHHFHDREEGRSYWWKKMERPPAVYTPIPGHPRPHDGQIMYPNRVIDFTYFYIDRITVEINSDDIHLSPSEIEAIMPGYPLAELNKK